MNPASRRAARRPASAGAFTGPVRHLYVHVPFCRAKCDYCDFASEPVGDAPDGALLDRFVSGIAAEWERERAAHDVRRLRTLFFGGGTPSLLGPDRLERLLGLFRPVLTPQAEVTVETNPEDVDDRFAAWAAAAPVAGGAGAARGVRVSLGVQSFARAQRDALGRRAAADPAAAFARLRAAGVADLSIDLIHAIPGQTHADLESDIASVLALRPDHVSWYELTLAPGTPRARYARGTAPGDDADGQVDGPVAPADVTDITDPAEVVDAAVGAVCGTTGGTTGCTTGGTTGCTTGGTTGGATRDADTEAATVVTTGGTTVVTTGGTATEAATEAADDLRADLYDRVVRALSRAGYDWYEVSNYALPGHRARHNLAYWRARPYIGLGPGAVSTVGRERWTNLPDAAAWAAALEKGLRPPRETEDLPADTRARERLLLAARCGDPVPVAEIAAILDGDAAAMLAAAGLVSLHSGTIRVTRKGRYVAGQVCVRLFRD